MSVSYLKNDLVSRALGGKSVKCVVSENECIFTTDIETLLSSLDTEHPEIEIVLQSLKSHKAQHGEGTKSFLFMVTRFAKAANQLEQLGIASSISTNVMREAIDKLGKEVLQIGIPVVTSANNFPGQSEIDDGDTFNFDLDSVKNEKKKCITKGRYDDMRLAIDDENEKLDHNSPMPCLKGNLKESESVKSAMEADAVYLKMSECSSQPEALQQCRDEDDVNWFFDKQTSSVPVKSESCSLLLDIGMGSEMKSSQQHRNRVMDIVLNGKSSNVSEFDPDIASKNITHTNRNDAIHANVEKDSHDSDFEECFEEESYPSRVTVVVESKMTSQKSSEYKLDRNHSNVKQLVKSECLDFVASPNVSYPPRNSQSQIPDEFDSCFEQVSYREDEMDSCKDRNAIKTVTGDVNQECVKTYNKLELNHSLGKEVSAASEISKLNSLFKGIITHKTHSAKQVCFSTRHKLDLGNSDKIENQDSSSPATSRVLPTDMDGTHQENAKSVGRIENCQANGVDIVSCQIGVSKVNKINKMLKQISAQNPSTNMARIMSSSRHMDDRKGSHDQEEVTSVQTFNPSNVTSFKEIGGDAEKSFDLKGNIVNMESCVKSGKYSNANPAKVFEKDADNASMMSNQVRNDWVGDSIGVYKIGKELSNNINNVIGEMSDLQLQIPRDIRCLARESDDDELIQLVTQAYCFQDQDGTSENGWMRFDLSRVHCMSVQSSHCVRQVVRGLVVSCSSDVLEMIQASPQTRNTLLVNGDLKSSFVHKGHKPVVANKMVVNGGTSVDSLSDGKEHSWAAMVVDVLTKLQVDVLLVKGRASDTLCNMLYKENIVLIPNVPFRVLRMVSKSVDVSPLTYIEDATKNDVNQLQYRPLRKGWLDHGRDNGHCLHITDLSQLQTVVIQLPSAHSCQVEEEKVWKCLHRLSNALQDGAVLPGHGKAELWCQGRVKAMAQDWPGVKCPQTYMVLQALADVFNDYHAFVTLNVKSVTKDSRHTQQLPSPRSQHTPVSNYKGMNVNRSDEKLIPSSFPSNLLGDVKNQLNGDTFCDMPRREWIENTGIFSNRIEIGLEKEESNGVEWSRRSKMRHFGGGEDDELCYEVLQLDSFVSKVSSWSSALDLVQVLLSLDSLVVTGASSSDLGVGGVLL